MNNINKGMDLAWQTSRFLADKQQSGKNLVKHLLASPNKSRQSVVTAKTLTQAYKQDRQNFIGMIKENKQEVFKTLENAKMSGNYHEDVLEISWAISSLREKETPKEKFFSKFIELLIKK